ncbi:UPF0041-domain-containing protein [Sarocladium strictum]|jgi:hypothetical protein
MSSAGSAMFRASRPVFRQGNIHAQARQAFRANKLGQRFGQGERRWQSGSGAAGGAEQSWFKRMWESEVGIKTVHFWAPVMKWSLVLAGISDFARPAEKLSFTQNFALTCTGLIWTRWCFVIRPKNMLLAAVNFFLAIVGIVQLTRIGMYQSSQKSAGEIVEGMKEDVKETVAEAKTEVKEAVKN